MSNIKEQIKRGRDHAENALHAANGGNSVQGYRVQSAFATKCIFDALESIAHQQKKLKEKQEMEFWKRFSPKELLILGGLVVSPTILEVEKIKIFLSLLP